MNSSYTPLLVGGVAAALIGWYALSPSKKDDTPTPGPGNYDGITPKVNFDPGMTPARNAPVVAAPKAEQTRKALEAITALQQQYSATRAAAEAKAARVVIDGSIPPGNPATEGIRNQHIAAITQALAEQTKKFIDEARSGDPTASDAADVARLYTETDAVILEKAKHIWAQMEGIE